MNNPEHPTVPHQPPQSGESSSKIEIHVEQNPEQLRDEEKNPKKKEEDKRKKSQSPQPYQNPSNTVNSIQPVAELTIIPTLPTPAQGASRPKYQPPPKTKEEEEEEKPFFDYDRDPCMVSFCKILFTVLCF